MRPPAPGAAPGLLTDGLPAVDGFLPLDLPGRSADPLRWPGYGDQLAAAAARAGRERAVVTGTGEIGGHRCVLVAFDFAFLGGSVGEVESAAIAAAFEAAIREALPVVSLVSTGGTRIQEGTRALAGMRRVAAAVAAARLAGIPHLSVARHPTTGGMWASLAASADVVVATRGAAMSFAGSRLRPGGTAGTAEFTSEGKWRHGFVDVLCEPAEVTAVLAGLLGLLSPRSRGPGAQPPPPPPLPWPRPAPARGWAQVQRSRSAARPRWSDYLGGYFEAAVEIRGDRCGGLDEGIRCGFGRHDGQTVAYAAQTGVPVAAAGFRTATRLVRTAERLRLPLLLLVDTPGAAAGALDEAAGVGTAIAELLVAVAGCRVPATSVIVGEGGSGGAVALTVEGNTWVAPDGYLAVTAPEHAAAILKRPAAEVPVVADRLGLGPEELEELGLARRLPEMPRPA